MELSYQTQKAYYAELPELLSKFYSAEILRWFYSNICLKVRGEQVPKKLPNKTKIVDCLLDLAKDDALSQAFVDALPRDLTKVIKELLWSDYLDGIALQKKLGFTIFDSSPKTPHEPWTKPSKSKKKPPLAPQLELIVVHPRSYYYSSEETFPEHSLSLPPALKAWLRPYFPKPEGYYFRAADEAVAASDWFHFDGHQDTLQALTQIADAAARGAIETNNKGVPTKPSLRKIAQTSKARDFFPPEKTYKEFEYLRHTLLTTWMIEYAEPMQRRFIEGKIQPKAFFKSLIDEFPERIEYIYEQLLPHLSLRSAYMDYYHPEANQDGILEAAIQSIFGQLPSGEWVTGENLLSFLTYRDITLQPTLYRHLVSHIRRFDQSFYRGESASKTDIGTQLFRPLVTEPLLAGICFFFAAFGLLEIAFTTPCNERYKYRKKDFLTPFEGIRAIRLSPIGEYVFGKSDQLKLQSAKIERCELHFHPERLHVRVQNPDPVTQQALDEFLAPLGPGHYQLTRASIIGKASSLNQLRARVEQFKTQLGQDIPPNWKHAIAKLEAEPAVLNLQPATLVFQLSETPGIRQAFSTDAKLRELSTRAEGWRIIVAQENLGALKKRLRSLGFICE